MKRMQYVLIVFYFIPVVSSIMAGSDPSIHDLIITMNITAEDLVERGKKEIAVFVESGIWQNGYYEGDPTDISCRGSYHHLFPYKGQMAGPLYICYQECLRPYIDSSKTILEIGPGHGAWTKAMLKMNPKRIFCVDALSATYNQFWEYVGNSEKVEYHQIQDFSLECIPNDSIDFVFSFGVFCHISPLMIYEYFKNMHQKLRVGAEGFIMYADYDKKDVYEEKYRYGSLGTKQNDFVVLHEVITPGRWYHMGIGRMKDMLIQLGYEVINQDVNVNERDPIVHFRKK